MKLVIFSTALFLLNVFFSFSSTPTTTNEIILESYYYGENVYVMNPFNEQNYSVQAVYINNKISEVEINSSAFEIDLKNLNFEAGTPLKIRIVYDPTIGKPTIFNPKALDINEEFSFTASSVNRKTQQLCWEISSASISEVFEIEQFRWDKWLVVDIVDIADTVSKFSYCKEVKMHSGRNIFRVKYLARSGKIHYTDDIRHNSRESEVMLVSNRVKDVLNFSNKTGYQILDYEGHLIMSGYGYSVNIESLKRGEYYVNYDNKTEIFRKK